MVDFQTSPGRGQPAACPRRAPLFATTAVTPCRLWYAGPPDATPPRVSRAFFYSAPHAAAHNAVTVPPSHKATRRNSGKTASLGIPIRASVIDFRHVKDAVDDLKTIGITKIATDPVRHIGRDASTTPAPQELCGPCGHDVAAVSADGRVSRASSPAGSPPATSGRHP